MTSQSLASIGAHVVLCSYVVVATLTTSDTDLLKASSGLSLPIVSLLVPLVGFFVISPLLLVASQVGLGHILEKETDARHSPLGKSASAATPVAILCLGWRFADYQDYRISLFHLCILTISALLFALSGTAGETISRYDGPSRVRRHLDLATLPARRVIRSFPTTFVGGFLLSAVLLMIAIKTLVFWDVVVRDWDKSIVRREVVDEGHFINEEGAVGDPLWIIPTISIDRTTPLFEINEESISTRARVLGYADWQDYFQELGMSIDLRSRSLRFAYLFGQKIPRTWAHDARLDGANLSFASLYASVFVRTSLRDANLSMSDLSGAYLNDANLRRAELEQTSMRGADLDGAQLQGAILLGTDLRGASLTDTSLQSALINSPALDGAMLWDTRIYGVRNGGPQQRAFVLTPSGEEALDMSKPSAEEVASWNLPSLIADLPNVSELLIRVDPKTAAEKLMSTYCVSRISAENEAAARMLAKKLAPHWRDPAISIVAARITSEKRCEPLIRSLGEDEKLFSTQPR